ncbi:hypothetical protein CER18_06935 [Bartonella tribocorum]|uniref:Uncharacterized protein n=1 Tax=Bartonella tribocorum TaxID=85701 RepID=A0A2M6UQM2_9HYPH|nr:hypothetical protein CER18_06935 [Bartonella tribocorum]
MCIMAWNGVRERLWWEEACEWSDKFWMLCCFHGYGFKLKNNGVARLKFKSMVEIKHGKFEIIQLKVDPSASYPRLEDGLRILFMHDVFKELVVIVHLTEPQCVFEA